MEELHHGPRGIQSEYIEKRYNADNIFLSLDIHITHTHTYSDSFEYDFPGDDGIHRVVSALTSLELVILVTRYGDCISCKRGTY